MTYYEVTCPKCGDTIELNEEMLDEAPSIARTAAKRWSSTSKKTIPAIAAKTATAIRNNFRSYKPVKNGRVVLRLSFFFSHG